MSITEDCINAINEGEATIEDLVNIICQLEVSNHIKDGAINYLEKEVNLSNARAQKAEDTLYAFTHAGWKLKGADRSLSLPKSTLKDEPEMESDQIWKE